MLKRGRKLFPLVVLVLDHLAPRQDLVSDLYLRYLQNRCEPHSMCSSDLVGAVVLSRRELRLAHVQHQTNQEWLA